MSTKEIDPMIPIPVRAAKEIAERYGYDQVVIVARRVSDGDTEAGGEHVTTYGVNKIHCEIATMIGDYLKYKVMGWKKRDETKHEG